MIRILHVIDSLDLGGAQTALLNLVKFADRSRFRHEVAAMHGRGVFADAFAALGVPVHSLAAHRFPPAYVVNLPRLLRRERYDVVHCHLFASNWIAKPLAALAGVRCRYNSDQCNDAFRSDSPTVLLIDSLTNHLSTRVLAVSRSVAELLTDIEGLPSERVTLLPNSVDLTVFAPPTDESRRSARERFGLPPDATVIGGVGRLVHQKNFDLLLTAARPILRARPGSVLAFFGSGPDETALRKNAADLGDAVRFAGTVSDRASLYHALDVVVLPSRYEGLPMTVLEAMASGVPVVASSVDGVREIATSGKDAVLAPSGDATAFTRAIERVLDDGPFRQGLIQRARSLVHKRFDAQSLAADLEAWYLHDLAQVATTTAKNLTNG